MKKELTLDDIVKLPRKEKQKLFEKIVKDAGLEKEIGVDIRD